MKNSLVRIGLVTSLLITGGVAQAAETNLWQSTVAVGLTVTRGNTETLLGTLQYDAVRKKAPDELLLGAQGTYGEATIDDESRRTAAMIKAFGQFNRSFTDRWYGGIRGDFLHDAVADLKYRFTISPMAGYYAIKEMRTTLKFEAGPSAVFEKQGDESNQYAALRLGERFEHKFAEKSKMWQSLEFIPQIDRFHNYLIIAEIGAEAVIAGNLSLRGLIQDIYDNEPAEGRKKNDIKLITSLVYKF